MQKFDIVDFIKKTVANHATNEHKKYDQRFFGIGSVAGICFLVGSLSTDMGSQSFAEAFGSIGFATSMGGFLYAAHLVIIEAREAIFSPWSDSSHISSLAIYITILFGTAFISPVLILALSRLVALFM